MRACYLPEGGKRERGTQEQYEPYPSSLPFAFSFPDFDVALLVMPYFSWLLNPNGKNNVTKSSLLPECIYLTFNVTLKDGGTIWR